MKEASVTVRDRSSPGRSTSSRSASSPTPTASYQPDKIGQDTIRHSARYPSQLVLPVME